jgi:thiol-disulfide isomerase/thioredoxin
MILILTLLACTDTDQIAATDDTGAAPWVSPYTGGWPENLNKDALGDPGWDTEAEVGAQVPRFVAMDQYGEEVELYDFAGHGVPIVLDVGTEWCAPCQALAAFLSDGDMSHLVWDQDEETGEDEYYPWWDEDLEGLYDMVQDGELYWITVLFSESEVSGPTTSEDCAEWHEAYPNEMVPVLADTEVQLKSWLGVTSYPTLNMLNSDMVLEIHSTGGPYEVLRWIGDTLNE